MKTLNLILLLLILIPAIALATPSNQDRVKALELMYTVEQSQDLYFREHSFYETVKPRIKDGLIFGACSYSTFNGKGYMITVNKVEQGKVWAIERHFGDDASIAAKAHTEWACTNCNGESVTLDQHANEHGLCTL